MSFGAGHIQDMNNRLKQNRAQRPSQRKKFKDNNREWIHSKSSKPKKSTLKQIPEEKVKAAKLQIQKAAAKHRKKLRIFYGISLVFTLLVFIALYWFLN